MIPDLLKLGPISIHSFGLCVALALVASILMARISFRRNGLTESDGELFALVGCLVGIAGAKVWNSVEGAIFSNRPFSVSSFVDSIFSGSGLTFLGGFIPAALVLIYLASRRGIPFVKLFDSAGAPMLMAYMVGRLGCQLAGDGDYGISSSSFFAMSYSSGLIPTPEGVRVLATPLLESLFCGVVLIVLTKFDTFRFFQVPYRKGAFYFVAMSLERFLIEYVRVERRVLHNFSEAQIISIALFLIGVILLFRAPKMSNSVNV